MTLPSWANAAVHLSEPTATYSAELLLQAATAAPAELASGYVVYRGGHASGADIVHLPKVDGTEDFFSFQTAPAAPEIRYQVTPGTGIAGFRLVANTVELLDAGGSPRLRMLPPYIVGADGKRFAVAVGLQGCAFDTDPRRPWGRPVTSPGATTCTIHLSWAQAAPTYPALLDPSWSNPGNPGVARYLHTAMVIPSTNDILVAGGCSGSTYLGSAQLFNGSTWSSTGSLNTPRCSQTAALLQSGRILVIGGWTVDGSGVTSVASTSEEYDPGTGTWPAGNVKTMVTARVNHASASLTNGWVVAVGGQSTGSWSDVNATAEIYGSDAWYGAASMTTARRWHTANTLLVGGTDNVLAAGGATNTTGLQSTELFTPPSTLGQTGSWSAAANLNSARLDHSGVTLNTGKVLVAGGDDGSSPGYLASTEIYNPDVGSTGRWVSTGNLGQARAYAASVLLPSGQMGVFGGAWSTNVDAYDPLKSYNGSNPWSQPPSMTTGRDWATATVRSGAIYVIGGYNGSGALDVNEKLTLNANGSACTAGADCASGFCVASVCCNTECTGSCLGCATGTCVLNSGWSPTLPSGMTIPSNLPTPSITKTSGVDFQPANLQSVIDTATPGTEIVLSAGVTYPKIQLKNTTGSTDSWVVIRSNGSLTFGQRVKPSQADQLAKITVAATGDVAVSTATGATRYWLVGLELSPTSTFTSSQDTLVVIGDGNATSTSARDIILDRCFIHGNTNGPWRKGVMMGGENIAIIHSRISEISTNTTMLNDPNRVESQAIASFNGKGPYKIWDDYIEAGCHGVFFGGATSCTPDMIPSNIEVQGNHFHKPISWKDPTHHPHKWVKTHIEFKTGRKILIEENFFENVWKDSDGDQDGVAIGLASPRNETASTCNDTVADNPWSGIQDATVRNNRIFKAGRGIAIAAEDCVSSKYDDCRGPRSRQTSCIKVTNNVVSGTGSNRQLTASTYSTDPAYLGDGQGVLVTSGKIYGNAGITIDHNTIFHNWAVIFTGLSFNGGPSDIVANSGFSFTNNIHNWKDDTNPSATMGITGSGAGEGYGLDPNNVANSCFSKYFPGTNVYIHNVMRYISTSPTDNRKRYDSSASQVPCSDLTQLSCTAFDDDPVFQADPNFYRLADTSSYKGKCSHGITAGTPHDIGVQSENWTKLSNADSARDAQPACTLDTDCASGFVCGCFSGTMNCAASVPMFCRQ